MFIKFRECSNTPRIDGARDVYNYLLRDSDAISDIEIIDNNNIIESVVLTLGNDYREYVSEKINGSWDIKNWFTLEKPLVVAWIPFAHIELKIIAKTGSFTIKSNKMSFIDKFHYNDNSQLVNYNKMVILYQNGSINTYPHDCSVLKHLVEENPKEYISYQNRYGIFKYNENLKSIVEV